MKKVWILVLFLSVQYSWAQSYVFEKDKQDFYFLENPISINNGDVWDTFQQFEIKLPFEFPFMGKQFTQLSLECTGRIIFDKKHFYYIDGLVTQQLKDKGLSQSKSPISYQITDNKNGKAIIIEVKNAGRIGFPNQNINYQLYLYNSGQIAVHMGPSTTENIHFLTGLYFQQSFSPFVYQYGLNVFGAPSHPQTTVYKNQEVIRPFNSIQQTPKKGCIYRFSPMPSPKK